MLILCSLICYLIYRNRPIETNYFLGIYLAVVRASNGITQGRTSIELNVI
jgi:hypothetical protein